MMRQYDITIRCQGGRLPVILGALEGEELRGVVPVELPAKPQTKRAFTYANGHHLKGVSAIDLAYEVLKSEPRVWSIAEVATKFAARGFAGNSCTPALFALC